MFPHFMEEDIIHMGHLQVLKSRKPKLCTYRPVDQHDLIDDLGNVGTHVGGETEHDGVDKRVDESLAVLRQQGLHQATPHFIVISLL